MMSVASILSLRRERAAPLKAEVVQQPRELGGIDRLLQHQVERLRVGCLGVDVAGIDRDQDGALTQEVRAGERPPGGVGISG